jgi:GTPase SAR1 family protein
LLKKVYALYTKPADIEGTDMGDVGIEQMAMDAGVPLLHPRRKVTVLVVGNHSAGKSSFINWYTEQESLDTGVAVVSQGFTVVAHGKGTRDLEGEGAIVQNAHLKLLKEHLDADEYGQFLENLRVHVRSAPAKEFPLVDFIDSPGLVDGNVVYPFDVEKIIVSLADLADLIYVFMDPHGQALGTRTMSVVEKLNKTKHYNKIRYFLTKADTITDSGDLNKVVVQVTQNLTPRVANTHGFNVPTLWLPSKARHTDHLTGFHNGIGGLCNEIVHTVQNKIQGNLTRVKEDGERLCTAIDTLVKETAARNAKRRQLWTYRLLVWFMMAMTVASSTLDVLSTWRHKLPEAAAADFVTPLLEATAQPLETVQALHELVGAASVWQRLGQALVVTVVLGLVDFVFKWLLGRPSLAVRSKKDMKRIEGYKATLGRMGQYSDEMYQSFIKEAQAHEFEYE